jgi:hypothetical protein
VEGNGASIKKGVYTSQDTWGWASLEGTMRGQRDMVGQCLCTIERRTAAEAGSMTIVRD